MTTEAKTPPPTDEWPSTARLCGISRDADSTLPALGGVPGVVALLKTDAAAGLAGAADGVEAADVAARRARWGANRLVAKPPPGLLALYWEALQDRTLQILIVAALISLGLGIFEVLVPGEAAPGGCVGRCVASLGSKAAE